MSMPTPATSALPSCTGYGAASRTAGDRLPRGPAGRFHERQDRPQAALRIVEPLLTGPHADADLWTRAGQLYARLGRFEPAEQAFHQAIEEDPQAAEACFGLAEVLISAGRDAAEYAPWAEKAAALAPSVRTCLLAAAVRNERGDRRGALAAVEQAMRLDPGNPQVQRAYAELKANQ